MKKQTNAKKLRQIICTVLGITCVGIVLYAAFAFPKYYCRFNDSKTLNKLNYMDISVSTYETAYSSFAEKIHALARITSDGKSLQAVQINDAEMETSKKELTDIVNEEFINLYKYNVLPQKTKVSEKRNSLSQRYTIYEAGKKSNFKGISYWKLVYSSSKKTVTVYLDEEYHKIYYMKIQQNKADTDNAFVRSGTFSYSKAMNNMLTGYQQNCYEWWDGILRYYGLPSYKESAGQDIDMMSLTGYVYFDDDCQIPIQENYHDNRLYDNMSYVGDDYDSNVINYFWDSGIQIEEMIQF